MTLYDLNDLRLTNESLNVPNMFLNPRDEMTKTANSNYGSESIFYG